MICMLKILDTTDLCNIIVYFDHVNCWLSSLVNNIFDKYSKQKIVFFLFLKYHSIEIIYRPQILKIQ